MSQHTKIEWTDCSWPVIRGCTKVSAGCDNCWAIRDAHLHAGSPNAKARAHFEGLTHIQNGRPNWTGVVRLDESILEWPLRWKNPRRIFVASSGDLFHESIPDETIDRVFAVMALCPQHTFQVLTKRAERLAEWSHKSPQCSPLFNWPLPNVWLGVSVENQATADERIPWLLKTPAAVRWGSYEPALGPVDFERYLTGTPHLDWLVVGGES